MDWVDVAMEEYKTLREESLRSLDQAHHSVQLGLAAIAAITAFAATSSPYAPTPQDIAIAVAGPLVAALVWALWLLEVARSVRAGSHIALLEEHINLLVPSDAAALSWENKMLHESTVLGSYAYNQVIPLTLLATAIPSVVVGVVRLSKYHHGAGLVPLLAIGFVLLTAALLINCKVTTTMTHNRARAQCEAEKIRQRAAGTAPDV